MRLSIAAGFGAVLAAAGWRQEQEAPARHAVLQADVHTQLNAQQATLWLRQHKPSKLPSDTEAKLFDDVYQSENAEYATSAWQEFEYSKHVPQELFVNWVLPFVNYDEPVDAWRRPLYEKLRGEVQGKQTLRAAAEAAIPHVWASLGKKIEFKGNNTPGIMAPLSETLAHGYASCTGMSILLADSLRSVGIPARVVGTAQWNRPEGGNHNWVEVYWGTEGGDHDPQEDNWHFIDAVPGQLDWDSTWFSASQVQKAQAGSLSGIYVQVWNRDIATVRDGVTSMYTITWRDPWVEVPALERTQFYTQVKATDTANKDQI
jgi:hypothetical protein